MLKVPYGQDPYSVIGKYIRDHIAAIEDIIAVIEIDDITTNQLFMVDMDEENYFIWNNDWYEGEKDVTLIDFFPVSEAINPSAQPEPCEDAVSRKKMFKTITEYRNQLCEIFGDESGFVNTVDIVKHRLIALPSAQPEQKTGRWIIREGISDAQCSECKMYFKDVYDMDNSDAFCRCCGTKMEGLKVVKDE